MKVKFIGGVQQVTGSCTLLEYSIDNKTCKILVDCGIEQDSHGVKIVNWIFNPKDVDRVILTHAHMDHCGMLPLLYRKGYKGKVFCTETTQDLAVIILKDLMKSGIFTKEEIDIISWEAVDAIAKDRKMGHMISLFDSVYCYFLRSSHMLGAAAVGITWSEAERNAPTSDDAQTTDDPQDDAPVITKESQRTILFSGDVGRVFDGDEKSIHKPNMYPYCSDHDVFLVLETTYGSRLHGENTGYRDKIAKLGEVVRSSLNLPGGKVDYPGVRHGAHPDDRGGSV